MAYSGLTLGKFNPYFHQHSPSPVWSGVTSSDALGHSKPGNLLPPWKLTQQNFVISTSCSYFSEISTSTRVQILYSPCCLHLGYSPRYEADTFKFAMSEWGVWARGLCDAERSQSPVTQPSLRAIGLISCWISSCILHQICACAFHNQTSLFFFFFFKRWRLQFMEWRLRCKLGINIVLRIGVVGSYLPVSIGSGWRYGM